MRFVRTVSDGSVEAVQDPKHGHQQQRKCSQAAHKLAQLYREANTSQTLQECVAQAVFLGGLNRRKRKSQKLRSCQTLVCSGCANWSGGNKLECQNPRALHYFCPRLPFSIPVHPVYLAWPD